jgi:hypothetical protein
MAAVLTYHPAIELGRYVIATYDDVIARAVVDHLSACPTTDRCGYVTVKSQAIHWYVADRAIQKAFLGLQAHDAA